MVLMIQCKNLKYIKYIMYISKSLFLLYILCIYERPNQVAFNVTSNDIN